MVYFSAPSLPSFSVNLYFSERLHRETEEKARQPETKLGASAQTRHGENIDLHAGILHESGISHIICG
jgi:hypothetical protein